MNNWNEGNSIGTMYVLEEKDLSRIGHSWMEGRLRAGDVVLCTAHSGDYFNDYILIDVYSNGINAILGASFGAYTMGTPTQWQPSAREYHLLLAGERVNINARENPLGEHPLYIELKNSKK